MRPSRLRQAKGFALAAFLLFPFVALLTNVAHLSLNWDQEVQRVFLLTTLQAAASAAVSVAVGILGGCGLLCLASRRLRRLVEGLALLPNAAPVLLLLLAVMQLFPAARGFPGIIFVHVLLNAGLISVQFANLVSHKISGMAELAYIEGASRWRFFWRGALPVLGPDLLQLFLFVFAVCFASFAVPLTLGGGQATSVEVLIYQKIRISADWSQAVGLAWLQMLVVLSLSWWLRRREGAPLAFRPVRTHLLEWSPGLAVVALPVVVLVFGLLGGLGSGFAQVASLPELREQLPVLLAGSVVVGTLSGLIVVAVLFAFAFARPEGGLRKFFGGYSAPSSVLVGFAILLVWRAPGPATFLKIPIGIALVTIPSFYRLQWSSVLSSLEGQITVARTLGAGESLIFRRLIFPQVIAPATRLGGIAALWAWGDFALSSVIAERPVTLAMAAQALMNSYRLDGATVLVWAVLFGGLVTYGFFAGAGYVLGTESQT